MKIKNYKKCFNQIKIYYLETHFFNSGSDWYLFRTKYHELNDTNLKN